MQKQDGFLAIHGEEPVLSVVDTMKPNYRTSLFPVKAL